MNHYKVLRVDPRATTEIIHAAYRLLTKELGPDNPDQRYLNEAHDVLMDPASRRAYDESLSPPTGKIVRIGNYRLIKKIAEGGFGATYLAEHEFLGTKVCIKKSLFISPLDQELMLQEARAIWDLRHWAIPAMRDILQLDDGSVAIVMSYVPGMNIQQIIEKHKSIDAEHVCWIAERCLNVLRYLHTEGGVIHGDVKPANIIVQNETHQVVLVDYGLALVKPGKGSTNKGYTPMFASPEQKANGTLLPESDLYSLGLTLIYALGGDPASGMVPDNTPEPVCKFIKKLIIHDIRRRCHWGNSDLCQMIKDVRLEAFGSATSRMKRFDI